MIIILLTLFYLLLTNIQITLSDVYVYNTSNKLYEDFDDQAPDFGPALSSGGIKGYITTTNPQNACKSILPPPNITTPGYYWIALIPRTKGNDSCEFQTKVRNAEAANFSAVIVYNYEDTLITMGRSGKDVHIPSTLITHSDGLTLISHYLYNKTAVNSTPTYYVKIAVERPFSFGLYVIPFVVVVGILFLGLIGFILVKWYLQRRRTRRHRLPRSALKQLKIKKFVKGGDPWEVCAICLDDYEDGAKLRILPCDHAYHMKCIDPWLLNNRRQCPVCKRYVFPNEENSDDENNDHQQQPRTPTEQTPLIHTNEITPSTEISRNRQLPERRLLNPTGSGLPNVSFELDESSDSDENLSSPPTRISRITTTDVVFNQPSSNSRRYGSVHSSSTTPHAANFFVGSSAGTIDNSNISARSVVEDVSDIEPIDDDNDDEQMHSVITSSEDNPAYVDDDDLITDGVQTHL